MPKVNKALRNKTLDREITENDKYLGLCKTEDDIRSISSPRDITVKGDTMKILPLLPKELLILLKPDKSVHSQWEHQEQ